MPLRVPLLVSCFVPLAVSLARRKRPAAGHLRVPLRVPLGVSLRVPLAVSRVRTAAGCLQTSQLLARRRDCGERRYGPLAGSAAGARGKWP